MDAILKIGVPVIIMVLFYVILKMVNRKDSPKDLFVKIRILFGCIGIGVFLSQAYYSETFRTAEPLVLLSLIVFYGVVSLQNKYLPFRKK